VKPDHQWLTAFVCDQGVFEWKRTPFGIKSTGSSYVRAVQQVLKPLKRFADSYVDDMSVFFRRVTFALAACEKIP